MAIKRPVLYLAPLVLVLAVFLTAQALLNSQEHLLWDEAVYVGIAKFLGSGAASGLYESIRPLALPAVMVPWWILGLDVLTMGKLIALFFSILTLIAVYVLGSSGGNRNVGALSAAILAFTPLFFFSAQDIMTEIPSMTCLLFALILALHKRPIWAGVVVGVAATLKFPHLLGVLILILWIPGFAQRIRVAFGFMVPMGVYLLTNQMLTGSAFEPIFVASRHGANIAYHQSGFFNNLFYYLVEPIKDNPLFVMGFVGLVVVWFSRKKMRSELRFLLFQASAYLLYFTWIPNKQLRFFLLFIPTVCIFAGMGIDAISRRIKCPDSAVVIIVLVVGIGLVWSTQGAYVEADDDRSEAIKVLATFQSPILTTDPILSAYTDHRYIPFYFFIYDEKNATQVFREHKAEAQAVIWWPQSFACEKYPGLGCEQMLADIQQELDSSWLLSLDTVVNNGPYRIYTRPTVAS